MVSYLVNVPKLVVNVFPETEYVKEAPDWFPGGTSTPQQVYWFVAG